MKSGTVSILGCGWLGVPLAKHLSSKGFSVKGSATSAEKCEIIQKEGIQSSRVILSESSVVVDDFQFFDCDVLIISIPPRRIEGIERIFPAQIAQLITLIVTHAIRKVIFISSTSVYPESGQIALETDSSSPDKESGKAILSAENLLNNQKKFKTTILRFGGLIGADRNPARFLLKSKQPIANSPVNLIHQDDCIGIITAIIHQELWEEILNACCPEHPYKKDFYGKAARISGLPEPVISDQVEAYKIVDSSKLKNLLHYQFKYSSPMEYLDDLDAENT
jgi:nucleoside-diphosphate-sugar epimerase